MPIKTREDDHRARSPLPPQIEEARAAAATAQARVAELENILEEARVALEKAIEEKEAKVGCCLVYNVFKISNHTGWSWSLCVCV